MGTYVVLLALSPVFGVLAALAGWRTGARWRDEEDETDDLVASTTGAPVAAASAFESDELRDQQDHAASLNDTWRARMLADTNDQLPRWEILAPALVAGLIVGAAAIAAFSGVRAGIAAGLGWAFIYAAYVDIRARLLPDWPAALTALIGLYFYWDAVGAPGLVLSAAGALGAGAGLLVLSLLMRRRMGRDALGLGDVKLAMAGGALVGPVTIWTAIGCAAAATALWAVIVMYLRSGRIDRLQEIPFGPALLASIWIAWVAGQGEAAGAWWF